MKDPLRLVGENIQEMMEEAAWEASESLMVKLWEKLTFIPEGQMEERQEREMQIDKPDSPSTLRREREGQTGTETLWKCDGGRRLRTIKKD